MKILYIHNNEILLKILKMQLVHTCKCMPTLMRTLVSLKMSTSIAAALLFSNTSWVSTLATSSSPGCTVNSFVVQRLMAHVNTKRQVDLVHCTRYVSYMYMYTITHHTHITYINTHRTTHTQVHKRTHACTHSHVTTPHRKRITTKDSQW